MINSQLVGSYRSNKFYSDTIDYDGREKQATDMFYQ